MGLLPRGRAAARDGKTQERQDHPETYRVEVDTEPHHFPAHTAFSFWSAVQYMFVLSLLLWWLPYNIGGMVAGYVGGRRSGSHWKAVLAALVPVLFFAAIEWLGSHGVGFGAGAYIAALPGAIAQALAGAFPPATPYIEFVAAYFTTFVHALESTLAMQPNGYLIVVVFAYVGGIVGEQARREMGEEVPSASIRIVQPVVERLRHPVASVRWPHLAAGRRPEGAVAAAGSAKPRAESGAARHGVPRRFSEFRKIEAQAVVRQRLGAKPRVPKAEAGPRSPPRPEPVRDRQRDLATQRFVERALRAYERPQRRAG